MLEGKTAFVTGGSSGNRKATAKRFVDQLTIWGIDQEVVQL